MPVKDFFGGKPAVSIACTDDNGEETKEVKKETQKDFFIIQQEMSFAATTKVLLPSSPAVYLYSLLHIVETPPPDLA